MYPASVPGAGPAGSSVSGSIAYRMNRTPLLGAPVRAVVSYWSAVKSHSNVLPTNAGGNSAATAFTLISGLSSRANTRAASIRRAYGCSRVEWSSGFVAPASASAASGAGADGVIDVDTELRLCSGAALNTVPSAASSAAVA